MVFRRAKKPKRVLRAAEEIPELKKPTLFKKAPKSVLKPAEVAPEVEEPALEAPEAPPPVEEVEAPKPIEEPPPPKMEEASKPVEKPPVEVKVPKPVEKPKPIERPVARGAPPPAEKSIIEALQTDSALEELQQRLEARQEVEARRAVRVKRPAMVRRRVPKPIEKPPVEKIAPKPAKRLGLKKVKKFPSVRGKKVGPARKPRVKKKGKFVERPTLAGEKKVKAVKKLKIAKGAPKPVEESPVEIRAPEPVGRPKPVEKPPVERRAHRVEGRVPKPVEHRLRERVAKPIKGLVPAKRRVTKPILKAEAVEVEKPPLEALQADSALEELQQRLEARQEVEALKAFEEYTTFEPPKGYQEVERYWIAKPYAWAAILFDPEKNERLYYLVEPTLTPFEKTVLETLHEHLLDRLSYDETMKDRDVIIKNKALELLDEYGVSLDEKSVNKVLYYLKRNYIGYGKIDSILKDPRIEDISCDGVDIPIFLYHRDHQNIRTNLVFKDAEELDLFVIRIVERAGRQISLGRPTVDAALPEGYRVQATIGTEITTRGSSFSIRKYTEEPFTPVDLILHGTFSPEMLAYLWLATENKKNIMVVGGTASGKCVAGDTKVLLANSRLEEMRSLAGEAFKRGQVMETEDGWFVTDTDLKVFSMGPDLKIAPVKVSKVWKRRAPDFLYKVRTRSGKEITVTPEHPFFTMDGGVVERRADELEVGMKIATAEIASGDRGPCLASPEVFWDEIANVKRIKPTDPWVYDLTVDSTHNFVANGIIAHNTCTLNALSLFIPPDAKIVSIEDTRELTFYQDNWLASVTRDARGERAIDMYDLLRQALRQRPEVLIVGEVRGKEALTLFQAMSTGHSCYSTAHAGSIQEMVHRLEGEPINVPHHMLTALDIVCLQLLTYHRDKRVRRNQTIVEVLGVDPLSGALRTNRIFDRNPITDQFERIGNSQVLLEIARERGWSAIELERELKNRRRVLEYLAKNNMRRIGEVSAIIRQYYFDPAKVMEQIKS
ncbi:MAG: ATPase, T2SS/T4P/T4SS family [Candidatus Hodarchaeaceae archaeon]|nr:ATPase, T2SS/T4P/T4SS family [Candidatus Hodarchaeaceae archaeon]